MVEAARQAPESWIGVVDPAWKGDGAPPGWAVVGWWRSGRTGEAEEWQGNPEYRASPRALGFPDATDPVDAAVHMASTGYGTAEDVTLSLAGAEVGVFIESDGVPVRGTAPDSTAVVPIYTAPKHIRAAGRLLFDVRKVSALVQELPPGHQLYINPTGPVSMVVDTRALLMEIGSAAGLRDGDALFRAGLSLPLSAEIPGDGQDVISATVSVGPMARSSALAPTRNGPPTPPADR